MKYSEAKVQALYDQASQLLRNEIERRARSIMKRNRRCASFCMCMGTATFYSVNGSPIDADGINYLQEFDDFLNNWDGVYRMTGDPMKIEGHAAPLLTDW